jgi:hypothetical protein
MQPCERLAVLPAAVIAVATPALGAPCGPVASVLPPFGAMNPLVVLTESATAMMSCLPVIALVAVPTVGDVSVLTAATVLPHRPAVVILTAAMARLGTCAVVMAALAVLFEPAAPMVPACLLAISPLGAWPRMAPTGALTAPPPISIVPISPGRRRRENQRRQYQARGEDRTFPVRHHGVSPHTCPCSRRSALARLLLFIIGGKTQCLVPEIIRFSRTVIEAELVVGLVANRGKGLLPRSVPQGEDGWRSDARLERGTYDCNTVSRSPQRK